jgi:hypothetical protein
MYQTGLRVQPLMYQELLRVKSQKELLVRRVLAHSG